MGTNQRVALVTGSSSGIGRAICERLVAAKYEVYGTFRGDPSDAPQGVRPLKMDVREDSSVAHAVAELVGASGRLDVLVNNAGGTVVGAVEETDTAQAQALFDLNFFGAVRVTRAVLPTMRAQNAGRILFISSVVGFLPAPFMGFYSASKHAIEGYAESLDHEVRTLGVRAVLIEPSFMRTKIDKNGVQAATPIPVYTEMRDRVARSLAANIEAGEDAAVVAAKALRAASDPSPRLRYPVGKGAKMLARLRSLLPAAMFDGALRKNFRLDA
jgi:NAD(P)-dependent dehydrogenase (short-subunit alcohol dehydrogenase family)